MDDARMRRWFPLIVLTMVGIAAYFQASGFATLLGSSIDEVPPVASAPPLPPESDEVGQIDLPEPSREPKGGAAPEAEGVAGQPDAADCAFGRVTIIVAADDAAHSFATVAGPDGKAKMLRVGDELEGYQVTSMTWDRVRFRKGATECELAVGGKGTETPSAKNAAGVEAVSDTEFHVDRAVITEAMNELGAPRGARMRPVKEGDEVVGLRLSRIAPGSLLESLGMRNGDQLESIDGQRIERPEDAIAGYRRLATADSLRVELRRAGQPMTIAIRVR